MGTTLMRPLRWSICSALRYLRALNLDATPPQPRQVAVRALLLFIQTRHPHSARGGGLLHKSSASSSSSAKYPGTAGHRAGHSHQVSDT